MFIFNIYRKEEEGEEQVVHENNIFARSYFIIWPATPSAATAPF